MPSASDFYDELQGAQDQLQGANPGAVSRISRRALDQPGSPAGYSGLG